MHLGSCGACKMAWICDCAGGREETTWWTCSVSRLVFLICLHYVSLVFFWKHPLPLPRLRAAVFVNLVAMRAAMSDSSNTGVKLTDSNLQMLQRANYLFHSAHNWCLAALLLMCQFSLQRSVISLLKKNLIILYLRACDWSFGKRKSTLAHTSKVPQVTCVHISVLPAGK